MVEMKDGIFVKWGFNSRLDNLQAAFLNFKLKNYQKDIDRRREIASIYNQNLSDVKQIHLPEPPNSNPDYYDVFQNYEIECENRDGLKQYLSDNGIGSLIQWNGQASTFYSFFRIHRQGFAYTEEMYKRCLMIPMNTTLTNEDIRYISEKIIDFYE